MQRTGLLQLSLLVAVGVLSAAAVFLLARDTSRDDDGPTLRVPPVETASGVMPPHEEEAPLVLPPGSANGIVARVTLAPRIVFFGDTMRAHFDVALDRGRVDPDSVRVEAQLAPWELVGAPRRERDDAGSTTHLRWTYTLRCLTGPCVPPRAASPLEFDPARVSYASAGVGATTGRRSFQARFPLLVVYSRYTAASFENAAVAPTPWRADVGTLPQVSYRLSPPLALGLLGLTSALALAAAAALAYAARGPRVPAPAPEPAREPMPPLTPLEQALTLLDDTARADGVGDQRRALELVSEALEEWGDDELAGAARGLAWSEGVPDAERTSALAARVRAELERELLERAERDQNGARRVE